jgi:predicted RNase H-like nuclease (RuvC/YqgF family)
VRASRSLSAGPSTSNLTRPSNSIPKASVDTGKEHLAKGVSTLLVVIKEQKKEIEKLKQALRAETKKAQKVEKDADQAKQQVEDYKREAADQAENCKKLQTKFDQLKGVVNSD